MDAARDRRTVAMAPSALALFGTHRGVARARELALTREQPMLALKAYSAWMRGGGVAAPARAAALLDFTLYCNKFALQTWETDGARPDAQHVLARDYFQLVMDEYNAFYNIALPNVDAPCPDGVPTSMSVSEANTDSVPGGLRAALLLTIGNRACVELRGGGDGVATAERLVLLSRQLEEQMGDAPSLGWTWRTVRELNAAVGAVMHCDFARAEAAARDALEVLEAHVEREGAESQSAAPPQEAGCADHASLLLALCHYTLGVVRENSSCEASLADYEQAIALVSDDVASSSLAAAMVRTKETLATYLEQQVRERLAAEEAVRAANVEKKNRGATRPKTGRAASSRRTPQKAGHARLSQSEPGPPPIAAPPIPDALRAHLAKAGLATELVRVGAVQSIYEILASSLPGCETAESIPQSLFADTRFEAGTDEGLFAVLLCSATPLQWTLRLLEAAAQPVTMRHSVWTPRPVLATLLVEMAAQRPPAQRSTAAQQTRKEIADGNGKLRQQVLQLFAPPPTTPTAKQKAHESVDAVMALLGQRLSLLLKTERAFEEHWIATERIRAAMRAFVIPQDVLRLKRVLLTEKRLRERRRERSARIIVHFFRHVVKQQSLRAEQTLIDRRRLEEREAAAVTLQKYIRRWCAYQEAARRHAARKEYVETIVVVQSVARRRAAARFCAEERGVRQRDELAHAQLMLVTCAALQIQRVYRGHCARLRCYHLRGHTHTATLHHMRDSRHYYATLIQKRVRGMLARLRYGSAVRASRCYGRNIYKTRLWERSCVLIQRAYRAYRARRRTLGYRGFSAGRCIAGADGVVAAAEGQRVAAAHSIQQMYRTCTAKRRLAALRYARSQEARAAAPEWGTRSTFSLKDCVF